MRIAVFRSVDSRKLLEDKYNNGASVQDLMKVFNCSYFPIYKELRRGVVGYVGNRPIYSANKAQSAYEDELYRFVARQLQ